MMVMHYKLNSVQIMDWWYIDKDESCGNIKFYYFLLSVHCWNGHQLLVRLLHLFRLFHLLHPLCLLWLPRHYPLAFQQNPFGFSQKEKGFKPKSSWEKPKGTGWKAKRREKKEQEAEEQSSKDLIPHFW